MSGIKLYLTKTALQKLLHNEAVFIGYNSMLDIVPCLVLIFRTDYGKKKDVLSITDTFQETLKMSKIIK